MRPLDRSRQIKLMVTAKERIERTIERQMADPQLRAMFARPAPGQPSNPSKCNS